MNRVRDEGGRRWLEAGAISAAFHVLLFAFLAFAVLRPTEPIPVMTVRLVDAPAHKPAGKEGASGGSGSPAMTAQKQQSAKSAPAVRPVQKPAPAKTVVKQPSRPAEAINKAAPKTADQTSAESLPTAQTQDDAANIAGTGGGTAGGAGTGYGSGTGTGPAHGEGSGLGGSGSGAGGGGYGEIADIGSLTVLHKVLPEYPLFSRKRGEEGKCTVVAALSEGAVSSAEVERSSGFQRLDAAALAAVKKWRFKETGRIRVRIPFVFSLKK